MTLDDVGDPDGVPLLYLHGTPDSRLARPADDAVAERTGVRLLALDRHGYGGSDPLPLGSPWMEPLARDVTAVLDDSQVERVVLLAWSGGAALVLAASLPARVSSLGIVAGVVPREAYDDPVVRDAAAERLRTLELVDAVPPVDLSEAVAPCWRPIRAITPWRSTIRPSTETRPAPASWRRSPAAPIAWPTPWSRQCGTDWRALRPTSRHRPARSTSILSESPARPASATDPPTSLRRRRSASGMPESCRPRRSTSSPAQRTTCFTRWADILATLAATHGS
jgi:pimeloyl-ACP methyl ester carboxylesterase